MKIIDLVGVPIPKNASVFSTDTAALKKIKRAEDLIEIKADITEVKEALLSLKNSLDKDQNEILSLLGSKPYQLSEIILQFIIITYSKAFSRSPGRMNLSNKVDEIFGDKKEHHELIINLRNNFYAHQEIQANSHQLFCLPNKPDETSISLNPNSQIIRVHVARSIDLHKVELAIHSLLEYLDENIQKVCKSIESSLSKKQIEYINNTPKPKMLEEHWDENSPNRKNTFQSRKA